MVGRAVSLRSAVAVAIGGLARRAIDVPPETLPNDPRALKLAENLLGLLGLDNRSSPVRIDRRGRPRTHDMGFAWACLIEMAIESPEGLPSKNQVLSARLRDRMAEAGKPVPGATWLSKTVGRFYASVNRLTLDAMSRYRSSVDLQRTFGNESAYVSWRRSCTLAEWQWRSSLDVQKQCGSLPDYIRHRAETGTSVGFQLRLWSDTACAGATEAAPVMTLPGIREASSDGAPSPSASESAAFYNEVAAAWNNEPGVDKSFVDFPAYQKAREFDYCRSNAIGLEHLRGETNVPGGVLDRLAQAGGRPSVEVVAMVNAAYDVWLASADLRCELISFNAYVSRLVLDPVTCSTGVPSSPPIEHQSLAQRPSTPSGDIMS